MWVLTKRLNLENIRKAGNNQFPQQEAQDTRRGVRRRSL